MSSFHKRSLCSAGVILLIGMAGCSRSHVIPVEGVLTFKGKPVPNARLTFEPEHGRQSWCDTDEQGRFRIQYDRHQEGAVIGRHKVFIEVVASTDAQREAIMQGKQPPLPPEMKAFFNKYSVTNSKYTVEITRDTRELKLELD
jgi:hypothetical protein